MKEAASEDLACCGPRVAHPRGSHCVQLCRRRPLGRVGRDLRGRRWAVREGDTSKAFSRALEGSRSLMVAIYDIFIIFLPF